MGQSAKHIVTLSLVLQGIGCVATQHEFEQTAIRRTVLNLYEEQVMDNLIRVYNLRPIIQMRYSGITGEIKQTAAGSLGGSQQDAAGAITNMFDYNVEASRENTLSVTADPILDDGSWEKQPARIVDGHEIATYEKVESIYQKYMRFVWNPKADLVTKLVEKQTRVTLKAMPENNKRASAAVLQAMLEKAREAPPQAQFRNPSPSEVGQAIAAFGESLKATLNELGLPAVNIDVPKPKEIDEFRPTGMLRCTPVEPPGQPRVYHEKKKYKGKYDDKAKWYWIPIKYRWQYFELAQSVTGGLGEAAQRGATSDGIMTELRLQRLRD